MAYRNSTVALGNGARTQDVVDRAINTVLSDGEVQLAAQPVIPIRAGASPQSWVELLIRPSHDGVALQPDAVIDRAAETGLARPLDLLVLGAGLEWMSHAPEVELCSINVSGQSVSNPSFLNDVLRLIDRSGVDPSRLCLEVTETVPIGNFGSARDFARRLRGAGCRMALDDFGTGSSNMLMLVPMEMDFLKIDGRFIRHMPERSDYTKLVRGIVAFAETVGLRTVAECVETAQQFACMDEMGVNFIQGYYRQGEPRELESGRVRSLAWDRSEKVRGVNGTANGIGTTGE